MLMGLKRMLTVTACVVCVAFSLITKCSSRTLLIFMKQEGSLYQQNKNEAIQSFSLSR